MFAPTTTNSSAINNLLDYQNSQNDPIDLIEIVDCLKAYGLLDDMPASEKIMLDDFCDDLRLPASERRFSNYFARRMSDFITRRLSLLPYQTKNNTTTTRLQDSEDAVVSNQQVDMDENPMKMNNVSTSSLLNVQEHSDMKLFPYPSVGGQSTENIAHNFAMNNLYLPGNDMNMNAELYLAIHDRLRRLKQEELQLHLLLQTTPNPFQNDSFLQDGDINILSLSRGLDLESQRQLRRLSLLAVAEAIGLPSQDILNLQLNRREYLSSNFDYANNLQSGFMNQSSPLQDFNTGGNDYMMDRPALNHHRESSGDLTSSILDEVDTDALVSTLKPDEHEDQRRGSLDLLGTVAAAASENNSASQGPISKGNSMESTFQDYMAYTGQQPVTVSPRHTLGDFHSSKKKRPFIEVDSSESVDMKRSQMNSISEAPRVNSDQMRQAMENLKQAMTKSQNSQKNIQKWDKQFGLKRSHSLTMTKTAKSRNQVRLMLDQLRIILPASEGEN